MMLVDLTDFVRFWRPIFDIYIQIWTNYLAYQGGEAESSSRNNDIAVDCLTSTKLGFSGIDGSFQLTAGELGKLTFTALTPAFTSLRHFCSCIIFALQLLFLGSNLSTSLEFQPDSA